MKNDTGRPSRSPAPSGQPAGYEPAAGERDTAFKSVYGQLMSGGAFGLSPAQEVALRDLDGIMVVAEHVLRGVPVGAGAHSTICALLMDAYAKGRRVAETRHNTPDGG